jgi:hypothetical protein
VNTESDDFACWDPKCTAHEDNYVGSPDVVPEGEFVQRHDGNSNIHIAQGVRPDERLGALVRMACGAAWYMTALRHANGDSPSQCAVCWEAM